jgi:hypothetical protein
MPYQTKYILIDQKKILDQPRKRWEAEGEEE